MNVFVEPKDELSTLINEQANVLYQRLLSLPVDTISMPDFAKNYYRDRHIDRLYFSVQTAAIMLCDGIRMTGKDWKDVVVMEYGAGMGSLYLLTSMIGCKAVIYDDIEPRMMEGARSVAAFLDIKIDHFICGDHQYAIEYMKQHQVQCDIILSRNVIEHIYDLDDFYGSMAAAQPQAILYFSTTANYYNPLMYAFHYYVHRKFEKLYLPQRGKIIKDIFPEISDADLSVLSKATRGLAMQDLEKAVIAFRDRKILPDPSRFYTNTCDPESGMWQENLLKKSDYKRIITSKGYTLIYRSAFWDTHYSGSFKNMAARGMNVITRLLGPDRGVYTSPFVYIIAVPEKKAQAS